MHNLPPYATRELIYERLPLIFPEGTANRGYMIREMAASAIFTMMYIGAVAGNETYIGPIYICRMTNEQAALAEDSDRTTYKLNVTKKSFRPIGINWYADNTREPIRDETLREGLVQIGAVISLKNLPTTSSKPRYALQKSFSELFNPELSGEELNKQLEDWRETNLSNSARTRIFLANRSSQSSLDKVLITFPNGEARNVSSRPSSDISKAVIEVFAQTFLINPTVLWLSTSDEKVDFFDEHIASRLGLKIQADKNLPDLILVDLGRSAPLFVFVEVVATDGAITERRQDAIYKLTDSAGFNRQDIAFVTAYMDKQTSGFKKTISGVAWKSFAWFVSEPDKIVVFQDSPLSLVEIIKNFTLDNEKNF